MRAIDADAAGRELKTAALKRENFPQIGLVLVDEIARYLDTCPTLDVAPVRHGRWVRCKGKSTLWHCSECGERIVYNSTRKTYNVRKKNVAEVNQFCRACGAKMDAGQEDDDDA